MSKLFTLPQEVLLSNSGALIPGAKAYFYTAGTSTPLAVYQDYDLATPHSDPVVADGDGRFPAIFYDPASNYKVKLTDASDVEIYTQDYAASPTSAAEIYPTSNDLAQDLNSLARTANEISAGVVPTDYSYAPGNVLRYGADNTGVTDASSAIQDAIDVTLEVVFPPGTYLVQTNLTLRSGSKLMGQGRPTIKTDGTNRLVSAIGTLGTVSAITADVTRGDTTIAVAAGTGSNYTDGFYIRSERQPLGHSGLKSGEMGIVNSVATDTVTIDGMILGVEDRATPTATYATSDTASAAPVTFLSNIVVEGLKFTNDTYDSSPTTATSALLYFELVREFTVRDCIFEKNNQGAAYFFNCINGSFTNNQVARLRDDTGILGYGVEVGYSSANITVDGNVFRECRHGFTTGTGTSSSLTPGYGVQRGITVSGNSVRDCTSIGIDTHEDSDGVTITGNTVTGCTPAGIQVRCYRTTVTGNTVTSCKGKGIRVDSSSLDTVISGNVISSIGLNSADGYGIEVDGKSVTITGNAVSHCYSDGIRAGSGASRSVHIIANECKNNGDGGTGDGIRISRGGTISRLFVFGNVCTDDQASKTQRDGLRIDTGTTTSTATCMIASNLLYANATSDYTNNGTNAPREHMNIGHVTENSGTGSIASGTTSDVITHGLDVTPTAANITVTLTEDPTNTPGAIWVDTIGATTFTVNCENDPGASNLDFSWQAIVI